jgi:hypothetical protein
MKAVRVLSILLLTIVAHRVAAWGIHRGSLILGTLVAHRDEPPNVDRR